MNDARHHLDLTATVDRLELTATVDRLELTATVDRPPRIASAADSPSRRERHTSRGASVVDCVTAHRGLVDELVSQWLNGPASSAELDTRGRNRTVRSPPVRGIRMTTAMLSPGTSRSPMVGPRASARPSVVAIERTGRLVTTQGSTAVRSEDPSPSRRRSRMMARSSLPSAARKIRAKTPSAITSSVASGTTHLYVASRVRREVRLG